MSFPYVMVLHQAPTDGGDYRASISSSRFIRRCASRNLLKYLAGPGDRRRQLPVRHVARGEGRGAARSRRRALQGAGMRDPHDAARSRIRALHEAIRDEVVAACERAVDRGAVGGGARRRGRHDVRHRRRLRGGAARRGCRALSRASARACWWPRGWARTDAACLPDRHADETSVDWRIIVDPIDGTRGLMEQKRRAWVLTGVAPNRGPGESLAATSSWPCRPRSRS